MESYPAKRDPRNQIAAGLFFGCWAVIGWWSLATNVQIAGVDFGLDPGPGLLPSVVLWLLSLGSLGLVALGCLRWSQRSEQPIAWWAMARRATVPLLLIASLLAFVPAVRQVGFLPASLAFAIGWMAFLDGKQLRSDPRRSASAIALGTLIGVGLIYLLFIRWIGVPLR
jgi:hypothetical protein